MSKKFLTALVALVAVVSLNAATAFQVDVYVNGAESPSLSFGLGTAAEEHPAPPFSGMFGVVDVYLVSPVASPAQWFDRLSNCVYSTASGKDAWGIVVNSGSTLTFDGDETTPTLYYGYTDPDPNATVKFVSGELEADKGYSFSTGTIVTISTSEVTEESSIKEDSSSIENKILSDKDGVYVDTDKFSYPVSKNTIIVKFIGGNATIKTPEEDKVADWTFSLNVANYTTNYKWLKENLELEITLESETPSSRGDWSPIIVTALATSNPSLSPIQTVVSSEDNTRTTNWILRNDINLDFDNNGRVDYNDTIYFYNFIGCIESGDEPEDIDEAKIAVYTDGVTSDELTIALNTLKAEYTKLNIDSTTEGGLEVSYNDTIYFYDYVGCLESGDAPEDIDTTKIAVYTDSVTSTQLTNALVWLNSHVPYTESEE